MTRGSAPGSRAAPTGVGTGSAPSLAAVTAPRVWQGVRFSPLPDPSVARGLFDFTAVHLPEPDRCAFGWGAFTVEAGTGRERLVGAMIAETAGGSVLLHGPVVVGHDDPREVAAQLVAVLLDHARALGTVTVFTRPQGLDRIWIRFGFIPVPETTLPAALAGRPGIGLYAWRDGSALWTLREAPRDTGA